MRQHILILLSVLAFPALGYDITGRIVSITDGDTVILLDAQQRQHKIRLSGIDAPESHQPFGQKSKSSLSAMVFNREVVAECGKTDKYRREICKIFVGRIDANLEQVKAGMAWWYRQYSKEQSPKDREDYEVAEFHAKTRRVGLWADKNPVPPWEWRHR